MNKKRTKTILCTIPQDIFGNRQKLELPLPPKIAIISLLNWMGKNGYNGEFYDIDLNLPSEKEIYDFFKEKNPDVIGISAVVSSSYYQVKRISSIIRKACKNAWIVLGGYMAASSYVLLNKTDVDVCFLGDGEKSFVKFLDFVEKNKKDKKELLKIKGLAFLNENKEFEFTGYGEAIENKEIPISDFKIMRENIKDEKLFLNSYFTDAYDCDFFRNDPRTFKSSRRKIASLWVAKGCPNRCTFCQRFCAGYRILNLNKIDKELKELKEKYGVGFISIVDENFGVNKIYAFEVARLLKKYEMLWCATGVQCNSFSFEDIKFLKEMGCTALKFGVESGSEKIIKIMEKRFKKEDVFRALKNVYELGIYSPLAFCIGMPGENNKTIMESGKFLAEICKEVKIPPQDIHIDLTYAFPLPGAPLYEYGQLRGVIGKTVDEEEKFLIYISDKNAKKNNFINLTGEDIKDVLFWELLLNYEAMKVYNKFNVKDERIMLHKRNMPFSKLKEAFRFFLEPASGLNWMFIRSKTVAKIPRTILYPLMRNLLYLEFRIHRDILAPFFRNLPIINKYDFTKKIIKYLDFPKFRKCEKLKEVASLREINNKLRDKLPIPQNLSDKNRQILLLGR